MPELADLDTTDHGERDAASIRILGFFFTVLGLLVLVGTFFTLSDETSPADSAQQEQTATSDETDAAADSEEVDNTKGKNVVVNKTRAAIVNAVSGILLTLVGVVMLWWAKRTMNPKVE